MAEGFVTGGLSHAVCSSSVSPQSFLTTWLIPPLPSCPLPAVAAKQLAKKFAALYYLLEDLLSPQKHYDVSGCPGLCWWMAPAAAACVAFAW